MTAHDPIAAAASATEAAERLLAAAKTAVRGRVSQDGKVSAKLFEREQHATHGLAWLATYVESLRQMRRWAQHLSADGRFGEIETLILTLAVAEYANQIAFGIPMSQNEIVRPADLGLGGDDVTAFVKDRKSVV
mgnify:FL=1